jgi:IS5 family transposase
MIQRTAFLPGLSHHLCGRQRRSQLDQWRAQAEQARQASLSRLSEIFGPWLPADLLAPKARGLNSRQRLYPLELTFWAFLSQVLSPGSSCREIVRKVQAWYAPQGGARPDSRTGAYCQARTRLPLAQLKATHEHLAQKLTAQNGPAELWLGRRVKVIDGTGLSMPDTAANQKAWPQPNTQKPGCGFPVVKLVACFCLASGALLHWVQGTLKEHDCRLLQKLLEVFQKGDVVLADRGFSSFANLAVLLARGVDAVLRLHQFRKLDWRSGRRLGRRDRVVRWSKGPFQGQLWTRAQWAELPAQLDVRVVEIQVAAPGFRTQKVVLVTTLLDAQQFSAAELGRLYFRRWAVELFFRDIKQTLGMDVLRCQTPAMVEKEIVMHALAYNLIRALMQDIARSHDLSVSHLSFKGTVDALRQWQELFEGSQDHPRRVRHLRRMFYQSVAGDPLLLRPGRSEPRAVKRRPKNFRLLTQPRAQMVVERCRKQSQKPSKKTLN